jgi:hypothetical protein
MIFCEIAEPMELYIPAKILLLYGHLILESEYTKLSKELVFSHKLF